MKQRALYLVAALGLGSYGAIAGCSSDENTNPPAPDAGGNDATIDTFVAPPPPPPPIDATPDRGQEQTGQSCKVPADCYTTIDASALKGAVQCLDRVTNGYCTHLCTGDNDCCAVAGECRTGLKQVCSPFESTGLDMCFLSCEPADIAAAVADAGIDAGATGDDYCKRYASPDFGCRSSGGGQNNRKVCVPVGAPPDGGTDAADGASDAPTDAPDGG